MEVIKKKLTNLKSKLEQAVDAADKAEQELEAINQQCEQVCIKREKEGIEMVYEYIVGDKNLLLNWKHHSRNVHLLLAGVTNHLYLCCCLYLYYYYIKY